MLRSKVALILGGSSPLSAGLALAAAKQDAIVVLVSSAEKEASETMLMLRAEKREGFFFYVRPHTGKCTCSANSAV